VPCVQCSFVVAVLAVLNSFFRRFSFFVCVVFRVSNTTQC
jgi:hypothetical protein